MLNKPADLAEARAMLKRLSGRTHTVYTGVCLKIAAESFEETHVVTCGVTFNVLNDDAITRYDAGRSLREGDVDGVVQAVRALRADAAAPGRARAAFEAAYCDAATLPQLDGVLDG